MTRGRKAMKKIKVRIVCKDRKCIYNNCSGNRCNRSIVAIREGKCLTITKSMWKRGGENV